LINIEASTLPVLIPSLIGLLRPQAPNALHELALQVLIKLATTSTQFKTQVSLVSDHERQQLEASLKLSATQQTQQANHGHSSVDWAPKAKPLKLDFSKYT